jgi:phenylalanyl-tRNA synthetase beta chain
LRRSRLDRLLGVSLADDEVESVLRRLGIELRREGVDWVASAPSHRYDVRIEEDLIEELVRVHGYDKIRRTSPLHAPTIHAIDETEVVLDSLRSVLLERDYFEAVTYSFVDPEIQQLVDPEHAPLPLANPISADLSQMRTSLWPGLLRAMQRNLNRQQPRVRLFETGLRYLQMGDELRQEPVLAGLATGSLFAEQWSAEDRAVDFYDVKADVEALFDVANAADLRFVAGTHPALHPGRSASVLQGERVVAQLGQLHPKLEKQLGLSQPVVLFEIDRAVLEACKLPNFKEISRFPSIRRDIALVTDRDMPMQQLLDCVWAAAPAILTEVLPFDIYTGERLGEGRKSVALGLILQDLCRTLTESEVDEAVSRIVVSLQENLGATLRE